MAAPLRMAHPQKRKRSGNAQQARKLLQPARADAIGAFLIFLNLLKSNAKRVRELFLAHADHQPPHSQAGADMNVDRVGGFLHERTVPASDVRAMKIRARLSSALAIGVKNPSRCAFGGQSAQRRPVSESPWTTNPPLRCSPPRCYARSSRCEMRNGGVAERLKAHAWKVCMRETVSRVRIPPPPPRSKSLISLSNCPFGTPILPLISDPCARPLF